jgi:hypothetical protein
MFNEFVFMSPLSAVKSLHGFVKNLHVKSSRIALDKNHIHHQEQLFGFKIQGSIECRKCKEQFSTTPRIPTNYVLN